MPPATQIRGTQILDNSLNADDVSYSLDDAYDNGGAGLGRTITADAGAVTINGASATALIVSGTLELYGPSATGPAMKIVRGDLELNNSIKLEAGNGQNLQIFHDGANAAINNSTGHLLVSSPLNSRIEMTLSGTTASPQFRVRRNSGAVVETLFQVQADGFITIGSGSLGSTNVTNSLNGARIQGKQMAGSVQVVADSPVLNWNADSGNVFQVTLGGNRTMAAPTNLVAGGSYIMIIKQDGSGNRLMNWNSVYKFEGGSKALSTTANAADVVMFVSDGVNLYGRLMRNVS
jgi:hypothetical protein